MWGSPPPIPFWQLECQGAQEDREFGRMLLVSSRCLYLAASTTTYFENIHLGWNGKPVFIFLKCSQTGKKSLGSESIETREKKAAKSAFPNNLSSLIPPSGHWAHLQSVFWKIKWIFHLTSCIPEFVTSQSPVSKSKRVQCSLSCVSLQRNWLSNETRWTPWNTIVEYYSTHHFWCLCCFYPIYLGFTLL